jgi:ATPase subunit of ABC transporter with duplicated ATPase domains
MLLLDEPTNYLDFERAFWLKEYLALSRAPIFDIHDKAFLTDVTNYTFILENRPIRRCKATTNLMIKAKRYSARIF